MNTHLTRIVAFAIGIIAFLGSCGNKEKQFIVQGTINNADTLTLYLDRRTYSEITTLDSLKLTNDGNFSFKVATLDYPEFYRLRLNNQSVNFSIDSTETVTINADKSTFATNYSIEGSYNSSRIKDAVLMQFTLKKTLANLKASYEQKQISDQTYLDSINSAIENYKEKTSNLILEDYRSTAAYFALFQKIDDMLIFDPYIKKDLNLFRAVATVWDTYYSTSPRTEQLKNYTLNAVANLKALQAKGNMLDSLAAAKEVDSKDFFTVSLPDINGKEISTQSLAGKFFLLDFTAYTTEYSFAHNIRLNRIYEKYKSKLEIYQVSFDNDKHRWSNIANNLPWICVWDNRSLNSPLIPKFNIEGLPSTYIFDNKGNIVKKVNIGEDLEKEISKVL